jgi:hypothetical protein
LAFQRSNLPHVEHNFQKIIAFLIPSLINIHFIWKEYRLGLGWYKEKTKEELSQLRMLDKGERFMLELRGTVAFMEEVEDKRRENFEIRRIQ